MTTRLADREAVQRGITGEGIRPTYGYYRQPNGWIKPAVVTELEELKYRREGWEPLPQYGRFDMGTGYAADHPLELLFMNGGAKDLCEDQIRQQGLYMNSPLIPTCRQPLTQAHKRHNPTCWVGATRVEFPQVAHMEGLGPFPCRFCDRRNATVQGRDQHEGVMHKDAQGDIRTGDALSKGLVDGLGVQGNKTTIDALTLLAKELTRLKRLAPVRKTRRRKAASPSRSSDN